MIEVDQLGVLVVDGLQWSGRIAFTTLDANGVSTPVLVIQDDAVEHGVVVLLNVCGPDGEQLSQVQDEGPDGACLVSCPENRWQLDAITRRYVVPATGGAKPELLEVSPVADRPGHYDVYRFLPPDPWTPLQTPAAALAPGEFKLVAVGHACVLLSGGETTLMTDPWLEGPAYGGTWWPGHTVVSEAWLAGAAKANAIYISRADEDHAHPQTLRALALRNPHVRILAGDVGVEAVATKAGLLNAAPVTIGEWHDVGPDMRLMILRDALRQDTHTCCIVDYKGHLVIHANDCRRPNGNRLPDAHVDALIATVARGGRAHPHCYLNYSDAEVQALTAQHNEKVLQDIRQLTAAVRPKVLAACAETYTAAADPDLQQRMAPSSADVVAAACRAADAIDGVSGWSPNYGSEAAGKWLPKHGSELDVIAGTERSPGYTNTIWTEQTVGRYRDAHELEVARLGPFDESFYAAYVNAVFDTLRMNLCLHIIEVHDDAFEAPGFAAGMRQRKQLFGWGIDLRTGTLLMEGAMPKDELPTLTICVRQTMLWHAMVHRSNWDFIAMGYNARMYAPPDVDHSRFWQHMRALPPPPFVAPLPLPTSGSTSRAPPPPSPDPVQMPPVPAWALVAAVGVLVAAWWLHSYRST